jgi:hypothetical protein
MDGTANEACISIDGSEICLYPDEARQMARKLIALADELADTDVEAGVSQ